MCSSSTSFKWLDILEKEFDKAFVNIDLLLGELNFKFHLHRLSSLRAIGTEILVSPFAAEFDGDDTDILHLVRKKLGTMCSCFSQLSHKALTIFQVNCKAEVSHKKHND